MLELHAVVKREMRERASERAHTHTLHVKVQLMARSQIYLPQRLTRQEIRI